MDKQIIKLEQYWMGRDKDYLEECTSEIIQNAKELLDKVNMFLYKIGVKEAHVNSGWRPQAVNSTLSNAGAKSNHIKALAVDLKDSDGKLREVVIANLEEAKRLGLYFEDFRWTPGWVHIQCRPPGSKKRVYIPSSKPATAPHAWTGVYDHSLDG